METLIAQKAPDFCVGAVLPGGTVDASFQLHRALNGRYGLLFFYPLAFTFVCPSELIALHHRVPQFRDKQVEVMAMSVDSVYTQLAWTRVPVDKGGIGAVQYTLLSDLDHSVSQAYGVEHPVQKIACRGAFLIDREGVVRAQWLHDLPLGRNLDEILRVVDALQFHEQHGEVCPAGWQAGDPGMQPHADGVASYLQQHADRL